jgi:hypothetical protein
VSVTGGVRVLTLNLWGLQGAWDERRAVLADGLRGLRPGVVSFQEAIVGDGYDQVADLLGPGTTSPTVPPTSWATSSSGSGSPWPPRGWSKSWAAGWVRATWWWPATSMRIPTLTAWRSGAVDGPWRARACATGTHGKARPGEAGHTFTPTNPLVAENKRALDRGRRIDYVFVRCDDSLHGPTLDVRACTLAFDEPVGGVWASAHFGVVAELSVPDVCF